LHFINLNKGINEKVDNNLVTLYDIDMKKKALDMIGLKEKERNIIAVLKILGSAKVTTISKQSGGVRTTTHFILTTLQKRNIVKKMKVKGHFEWTLNDLKDLQKKYSTSLEDLLNFYVDEKQIVPLTTYRGKEILKITDEIMGLNRSEQVYWIQGLKSAELMLSVMGSINMEKFYKTLKKRQIILEGIGGENTLKALDKLDIRTMKSHLGRLLVAYIVPDKYIQSEVDVITYRKKVVLMDFSKKTALSIEHPGICLTIQALFSFMVDHARKVDINSYMLQIMAKK
jgi:hypothetical protein